MYDYMLFITQNKKNLFLAFKIKLLTIFLACSLKIIRKLMIDNYHFSVYRQHFAPRIIFISYLVHLSLY